VEITEVWPKLPLEEGALRELLALCVLKFASEARARLAGRAITVVPGIKGGDVAAGAVMEVAGEGICRGERMRGGEGDTTVR